MLQNIVIDREFLDCAMSALRMFAIQCLVAKNAQPAFVVYIIINIHNTFNYGYGESISSITQASQPTQIHVMNHNHVQYFHDICIKISWQYDMNYCFGWGYTTKQELCMLSSKNSRKSFLTFVIPVHAWAIDRCQ